MDLLVFLEDPRKALEDYYTKAAEEAARLQEEYQAEQRAKNEKLERELLAKLQAKYGDSQITIG